MNNTNLKSLNQTIALLQSGITKRKKRLTEMHKIQKKMKNKLRKCYEIRRELQEDMELSTIVKQRLNEKSIKIDIDDIDDL